MVIIKPCQKVRKLYIIFEHHNVYRILWKPSSYLFFWPANGVRCSLMVKSTGFGYFKSRFNSWHSQLLLIWYCHTIYSNKTKNTSGPLSTLHTPHALKGKPSASLIYIVDRFRLGIGIEWYLYPREDKSLRFKEEEDLLMAKWMKPDLINTFLHQIMTWIGLTNLDGIWTVICTVLFHTFFSHQLRMRRIK